MVPAAEGDRWAPATGEERGCEIQSSSRESSSQGSDIVCVLGEGGGGVWVSVGGVCLCLDEGCVLCWMSRWGVVMSRWGNV